MEILFHERLHAELYSLVLRGDQNISIICELGYSQGRYIGLNVQYKSWCLLYGQM